PMRIGFFSALASFLVGSGLAVAQPPASPPMTGKPGPASPPAAAALPALPGNGYGTPPNGSAIPPFSPGTCGQSGCGNDNGDPTGGRFTFGAYLDECHSWGVEGSFFVLPTRSQFFNNTTGISPDVLTFNTGLSNNQFLVTGGGSPTTATGGTGTTVVVGGG